MRNIFQKYKMNNILSLLKNGELYILTPSTNEIRKLDFPRKIISTESIYSINVNFIDDLNFLYVARADSDKLAYSQTENMESVRDACNAGSYMFVIASDGSLLSKYELTNYGVSPYTLNMVRSYGKYFKNVDLMGLEAKFDRIASYGTRYAVAIDDNGNLWKTDTNETNNENKPIFYQITKDIDFVIAHISSHGLISAIDTNGNTYFLDFQNYGLLNIQGLKFIQCVTYKSSMYLIDINYNLWFSENFYNSPFRIIKTDIMSLSLVNRYEYDTNPVNYMPVMLSALYILTSDGTLMMSKSNSPDKFEVVTDIKFDKLFNTMENRNLARRFMRTKSAR